MQNQTLTVTFSQFDDKKHSVRYRADSNGKAAIALRDIYVDKLALAEKGLPQHNKLKVTIEVLPEAATERPAKVE